MPPVWDWLITPRKRLRCEGTRETWSEQDLSPNLCIIPPSVSLFSLLLLRFPNLPFSMLYCVSCKNVNHILHLLLTFCWGEEIEKKDIDFANLNVLPCRYKRKTAHWKTECPKSAFTERKNKQTKETTEYHYISYISFLGNVSSSVVLRWYFCFNLKEENLWEKLYWKKKHLHSETFKHVRGSRNLFLFSFFLFF